MRLDKICQPIRNELAGVERVLKDRLQNSKYKSILDINNFLLDTPGKRLRPALVLLSAKASHQTASSVHKLINIAVAVELIHMASLIHDDVIDKSHLRHNRPTINYKKGGDVAVALGDYLYSIAFELISKVGNTNILRCISRAAESMCEGELLQVCERDNLDLLKERYTIIVKKKTASLFAASCKVGNLIAKPNKSLSAALKGYGLNFGIAFQIIDDYLDLTGDEESLGKTPGQDIRAGEMTLPLLTLLESVSLGEREEIKTLLALKKKGDFLKRLKSELLNYGVAHKTKNIVLTYVASAKKRLTTLSDSPYKESLYALTDFIVERGFSDKG